MLDEKIFKLRYQRADLEFELNGLQDEKMTLDDALSEDKKGEAFVRRKERQINAQTLILGRELFSLLLRDVAIEETSRKAFETRVARIEIETAKKAAERNDLQERVLMLQTECQADLEQKRYVYDEIHVLQKRTDSLDAQISMLIEWRKSLEYQIKSVRTAIKQRQNIVSDPVVKSSSLKDSENKYFQQTFEQKFLSRENEIGLSLNNSDNGSVNDGDNEESSLQELHSPKFLMKPGNEGTEEKCKFLKHF
uniref:Uncharacterized protein n=1 Tax=Panagrolaimus superbus TaxID=310955 RepID=A0A914XVI7_9BILA